MAIIQVGGQVGQVQSANTVVTGAPSTNADSSNYYATATNTSAAAANTPNIQGSETLQANAWGWNVPGSGETNVIQVDLQTLPPSGNSPATWNFDNSLGSTAKYLQKLNNANIGQQP